nr:hypothetical protein [uncultured Cupriavidus sp.]
MRQRNLMPLSRPPVPALTHESAQIPPQKQENTSISAAALPQIRVDSPVMARIHQSLLTAFAARTATCGAIGMDSSGLTATTIKTITKKTIR